MSEVAQLEADTFRLDSLVEDVRRGRIRVPRFQRPYRWSPNDVLALFDSVYRGFPIGTLLFWRRAAESDEIVLGNDAVRIKAPAQADALWVVDGQQRITSLALTVLHELFPGPVDRQFQVLFDLRTEAFSSARADRVDDAQLPVNVAFDLQRLLASLRDRDLPAEHQDRAFGLAKRLRDYEVPAYLVSSTDDAVLRTIFDRMNTFGKRMRRSEVFHALHAVVEGSSEPSDLRQLQDRLSAKGYGEVDDDLVLLMTLASRGGDVSRDFRREFDQGGLTEAFRSTEAAFERAASFLQSEALFPHRRVLPYEYLLVVLVAFFTRHASPSPRNMVRLRRWVWRSALAGTEVLGGYTPTLRRSASVAATGSENEAVEGLLALVPTDRQADGLLPKEFRLNISANRIAVASLLALGPRDLVTGDLLDVDSLFGEGAPSVVRLFGRGEVSDGYNLLGNVLFVAPDRIDAELDESHQRRVLMANSYVLASHGMDHEFVALLRAGDAAGALARRQERIVTLARDTAKAMAEWDMSDRRAIDDLVAVDDRE